jgi:hypothetical protein
MPQRILVINCYVVENDNVVLSDACHNNVFTVKIPDSENISALKDLIKGYKKPVLDHIPAYKLSLWKVPIPVDVHCKKTVADLELVTENILSALESLSRLFPTKLNKNLLHIIVRSPPTCEYHFSLSSDYTHHVYIQLTNSPLPPMILERFEMVIIKSIGRTPLQARESLQLLRSFRNGPTT